MKGCGSLVLILLIVLAIGYIVHEPGPPTTSTTENPSHPKKVVKAGISIDRFTIQIRNDDNFEWQPLSVYINGLPFFGYGANISGLKPGQSARFRLNDFAKDNGDRFNPMTMKPVELWIGGGTDYDFSKYGF